MMLPKLLAPVPDRHARFFIIVGFGEQVVEFLLGKQVCLVALDE